MGPSRLKDNQPGNVARVAAETDRPWVPTKELGHR